MVKPPAIRKGIIAPVLMMNVRELAHIIKSYLPLLRLLILDSLWKRRRQETVMADRRGLKLVGLIFASITIAVMATTTVVVKSYADGVYTLESPPIHGR